MSLSSLSIQRPVLAWMLMVGCLLFGVVSYQRLGISQLPDVDFPVVNVSLTLTGAAPEVIESQVLDPVEDAIMQIEGVRNVTSTAQQSSGTITVEFDLDRNINDALQEVKNHIAQVNTLLPNQLMPPVLRKINPEDQPILWLALSCSDPHVPLMDLMIYVKDYLQNQFGIIPGVGNIALGGYIDPALRVWLDTDRMDKLDITADEIVSAIQAQQIETPVGSLDSKDSTQVLRFLGEARSAQDFGNIEIEQRSTAGVNYRSVKLHQLADVEEATADVRRLSRNNKIKAVGLGIIKQHGSNAVAVARAVKDKLNEIKNYLPKNFQLDVRGDNTRFIRESINELVFTLVLSVILTSLVCYLFLGSWSSTMNVLFAIPTSIVGTFTALHFFNFTLNTFTLLGLSLAIGIVVDDAIMMLENIVRHREMGFQKKEAALKGSEEITFGAIVATLAIVAIFIPVVFMKGVIGRYFFQYGLTVTVAVLLSLLEALTLTPMRCSRYLKIHSEKSRTGIIYWSDYYFKKLAFYYEKTLRFFLQHRWKTILGSILIFLTSFYFGKHIPAETMPAQDQSVMLLRFKLAVGTALGVTDSAIRQVEDYLQKLPEVEGVFSVIGGFGGDAVNQAITYVTLVPRRERQRSQKDLINQSRVDIKKMLPTVEVIAQDLSLRGFAASRGFPIEFIIQGSDWDVLTNSVQTAIARLKESPFIIDVNTDVQAGMPELQMVPDRDQLARHGVSLKTVTAIVNALMGGLILEGQTEYPKNNHRYEIGVRLKADQRAQLTDIQRITVRNNRGQRVRLSDLVRQEVKPNLLVISRFNRLRAITIYGNPAPGYSQQEAITSTEKLVRSILPPGYTLKMIGSSQNYRESIQSLLLVIGLGIVVSYMILGSQFNSFVHPIIVLLALPFSITGGLLALYLCHQSINIYSLIGFILLMGIVKKNSILLVDYTNQCRKEGESVQATLLRACPVRLRPILMTSIATIAAALPEALSLGPGSETTIPMAIAIIGGVIASSLLTLFIVPCAYSLIAK